MNQLVDLTTDHFIFPRHIFSVPYLLITFPCLSHLGESNHSGLCLNTRLMMFRFLVLFTVFCVVKTSKWDRDSLRINTNILDDEVLDYFSDFPNKVTDFALEGIRDYLVNNHETKIAIPTVDVNFTETVLGFDLINGEFKAYNGEFTNPATVKRRGDSHMNFKLTTSNLSTTIGFDDMEVYFPKYEMTVLGIGENGSVKVNIKTNEIYLNATITLVPKCTVSLTQIKLKKFQDIDSDITGLGILDGLAGEITSWVLSSFETSFSTLIENIVENKLKEVLAKTGGFCKYHAQPLNKEAATKRKIKCEKIKESSKYKCANIF